MKRELEIGSRATLLFASGLCLVGFVLFAPDAGHHRGLGFIHFVRQTSWHHRPFDWPAVWCSMKIILLSLGMALIIEAFGTILMKRGYELIGFLAYLLHVFPVLGLLAGGYYLVESLL
jgi:uncharacterized membrane protein SpoIIM required for sporulation